MGKKRNRRYSKGLVKGAYGVLLFLSCLLLFLSASTHLQCLSYPFIALFGLVGFYAFLLLGFFFGALLPFWDKVHHPKARNYFAYALLAFGLCLLLSHFGNQNGASPSNPGAFFATLNEKYASPSFSLLTDMRLAGGIVGYELSGLLNLAGGWLAIAVPSLILAASLFLFFLPLLKKLRLYARSRRALAKARGPKEMTKKARKGDSSLDVGEEDPAFSYHEKDIPRTSEDERNALLEKERKAMEEWDFRPSTSLSYSSRSEAKESEGIPEIAEASSPAISCPSSAEPIDTRFRGDEVQEPVFDFFSSKKEASASPSSSPETEAVPPAPSLPEEPVFSPSTFLPDFQKEEKSEEPIVENHEEEALSAPVIDSYNEPMKEAAQPSPAPSVESSPSLPSPAKEEKREEAPNNPEDAPAITLPKYVFPDVSMLDEPKNEAESLAIATQQAEENMARMNETLASLRAGASVVSYKIGPSVTRYDVQMDVGVQVNTVFKYETDISRCLAGLPARFVPIVKDKTTSAFEIGNRKRMSVCFKEVFSALPQGEQFNMVVPFGKSIDGEVVYGDLSSFPHMLVAGTTGSGKSIFIHSMLLTLLMRNRPEDLKLLMVDPKQVEFTAYDEMPNLLCPTITSPEKANVALHKLADLMDRRFELLRKAKVRDIRGYNSIYAPAHNKRKLSFIVVVVDEFAELAIQCKDISEPIQRLGQKGRACGIHMIIATQRPDANTISGTIKANLPVTVCLMVKNAIDSNVVLHAKGGEALLDHGDMLIDCPKLGREFVRAQGAMMGEYTELVKIPDFIRSQMGPIYDPEFLNLEPDQQVDEAASLVEMPNASEMKGMADEEKYQRIKGVIMQQESTSISQIQRNFGVGFPRAGKIVARLQNEGIVAKTSDAPGSSKGFKVLVHFDANEGGVANGDTPGSLSSAKTSYEEE